MAKRRGLGRGLDALLAGSSAASSLDKAQNGDFQLLPLDLIQCWRDQPRKFHHPEALEELASSIRSRGVVQPIVVRPTGDGAHYEIIAGERRWRAAQIAGLDEIPVIIRAEVADSAALAMALVENIQREDLNPIEEGSALKRLIDDFDMTHQQAADAVGRSRVSVTNLLRLLDLNEDVKALLVKGALEMGHARALLALDGRVQSEVAVQVVDKGLSARETERLVSKIKAGDKHSSPAPSTSDPDVRRLQTELSERLGAYVRIQHSAGGKGKLTIQYNSLDELDGILARIK